MMYFCLFALESTAYLSFTDCLVVFAIGTIGIVLPAPGAGAGTYHFFVMQSLLLFGVAKEDGIAYATMVHGVQMIVLLVIGAIASMLVIAKQKQKSRILIEAPESNYIEKHNAELQKGLNRIPIKLHKKRPNGIYHLSVELVEKNLNYKFMMP